MCYLCGAKQIHRMEVILEYLLNNWPSFTVVLIVGVTCFIVARKFTKWEYKNEQRHQESKNRLREVERRHSNVENTLKEIAQRIEIVERFLIKNGGANYNDFTKMNSPRQLNDKGRKLFEESGASIFFSERKEGMLRMLSSEMAKIRVKTALDVDTLSAKVCYDISGNKDFKPIKDFIYTHPIFEGSNVSIDTITMLRFCSNFMEFGIR